MTHYKLLIILSACLFLFAACSGPTFTEPTRPSINDSTTIPENYSTPIQVGGQNIFVEIVNTDATRAQGLSDRKELKNGQGMLFDFTNTSLTRPSFWMKDMHFDIDIIWINNGTIIGITPNVPAPSTPNNLPSYPPPSDVTHVLEVPSGWSERTNTKVGDLVKI